jgi:hypothetical protein
MKCLILKNGLLALSALTLSCAAQAEMIKPILPDSEAIKWTDAVKW